MRVVRLLTPVYWKKSQYPRDWKGLRIGDIIVIVHDVASGVVTFAYGFSKHGAGWIQYRCDIVKSYWWEELV